MSLIIITGCLSRGGIQLVSWELLKIQDPSTKVYEYYVKGRIKNNSGKDLDSIAIKFTLFDKEGNVKHITSREGKLAQGESSKFSEYNLGRDFTLIRLDTIKGLSELSHLIRIKVDETKQKADAKVEYL